MLQTTKAIVLHTIKYTENSLIVHVYTEEFGRMAYVVNGVKSKKSVLRSALLQPLSLLELETEHQPKRELQRIKESRICYTFLSTPYNPSKNALSLFIAELLYRSLKEPQVDKTLFNYLFESICLLDKEEEGVGNFHLIFMYQLCKFLGFEPHMDTYKELSFFDLQNGVFVTNSQISVLLSKEESLLLRSLSDLSFQSMNKNRFTKLEKRMLLEALIRYYKVHLSNFHHIKSLDILVQLFN